MMFLIAEKKIFFLKLSGTAINGFTLKAYNNNILYLNGSFPLMAIIFCILPRYKISCHAKLTV